MKNTNNQKGVSLILSFFIMLIILTVVLSVSVLLYGEIKILRNIGNSMVAFYGADSGVEKVLYYDRQVWPSKISDPSTTAERGMCSMYKNDLPEWNNSNYCASSGTNEDESVFCLNTKTPTGGSSCDPDVCDDCEISFETTLNNNLNGKPVNYSAKARVFNDGSNDYFQIESKGSYITENRQIQIEIITTD